MVFLSPVLCTVPPPATPEDLCALFGERPGWYRHARDAAERWQVGEPVMMAVIYQESGFRARARPPRRRLLRFIPWRRPTTAFGYAQVVEGTWRQYLSETGRSARRDRFAHAVDFVGWYLRELRQQLGLAADDAKNLYLAYHEGPGGYQRHSYRGQPVLIAAADQLAERTGRYQAQLEECRRELDRQLWLRRLRPFAFVALALAAFVLAHRWRYRSS